MKELSFLLFGALLGWLLQRLSDIITGPHIRIEIGHEAFLNQKTNNEVKFLHVKVKNMRRNFITQLFVGSKTASNAKAIVSFREIETNAELLSINGRWVTTKEPVDYKGGVNIGDALITSRETIPPGEESAVSIAIKKVGNNNFSAFNNESYLYAWYKPDFELTEKKYHVNVKISADGKEWNKEFTLINLGSSTRNFRLVE